MKIIYSMAVVLALAGCASAGVQVSREAATQFKEGVTTESEIRAKLGQPTSESVSSGDLHTLIYAGSQSSIKAATFIPLVGAFVGGADVHSTAAIYTINKDGVMIKFSYSGTGLSSQMGSNPANADAQPARAVQ